MRTILGSSNWTGGHSEGGLCAQRTNSFGNFKVCSSRSWVWIGVNPPTHTPTHTHLMTISASPWIRSKHPVLIYILSTKFCHFSRDLVLSLPRD